MQLGLRASRAWIRIAHAGVGLLLLGVLVGCSPDLGESTLRIEYYESDSAWVWFRLLIKDGTDGQIHT